MGEEYDKIVAALPRLTAEERGRVLERLKALAALDPSAAPTTVFGTTTLRADSPAPEDELLEVIAGTVRRKSGERASVAAMRRARGYSAFRSKAAALAEFAARHAPDRVRRRALLELGAELLYDHLARVGSASSRTLMLHAHRIPAAIDAAFPGYAQSGLLGMVVGRGIERRTGDGEAKEKRRAGAA